MFDFRAHFCHSILSASVTLWVNAPEGQKRFPISQSLKISDASPACRVSQAVSALPVLHVIPSLSVTRGGPSLAVRGMVRSLRSQGVAAEIATTDDDGPGLRFNTAYGSQSDFEGLPVAFFPKSTPDRREFLYCPPLIRWLERNAGRFGLIHTHYLFSHVSTRGAAVARKRKTPLVIRPLGTLAPWSLRQGKWKKRLYMTLFEGANLEGASAIHCTSPEELAEIRTLGIKTPAFWLPLGVEALPPLPDARTLLRKQFGLPPDAPVILFLSRLHPKKRPEILIESLPFLQKQIPEASLILAGDGDSSYAASLRALVKRHRLETRIFFPGIVTGPGKNLLLRGADCFALASETENFSIATAEALAAGLPVVITPDIQISRDVLLSESGKTASPDPTAFSEAILEILTGPALAARLSKNATRLAEERYSWNAITPKLKRIYECILTRQPFPESPFHADF